MEGIARYMENTYLYRIQMQAVFILLGEGGLGRAAGKASHELFIC